MVRIKVQVGESSYSDGRDVVWKAEKELDLFLDNWGSIYAATFRAPVTGSTTVSVRDTTNTARTLVAIGSGYQFIAGTPVMGTQVGVGSSSQAPARTDYNLISQLGSWSPTTSGVWTSSTGRITFSGSVLLSAGGTVREVGVLGVWNDSANVLRNILIIRDVIADVVIGAGKYAFVQYTIQL